MKKNFQIRGNLMIEVLKPFRRQQLSIHKQHRDKEIRKELQELQRKRTKDLLLQDQWKKEKKQLQEFKQYHQQNNEALIEKENKLKEEVFKLQIRKEQIESRTNPEIIKQKSKKLMQYLRCVPFTAGKRLQKIIFWGGEERYFRLKFLIEFGRDRFLKKSQTQREIFSNLQRIVFCKKIQFQGEWIMISIKETFNHPETFQTLSSGSHHVKSSLCPKVSFKEANYEIYVYAITGKYFCLKREYSYKNLFSWATLLGCKERPPKGVKPRLSVAENLAKQNALRELATKRISQINTESDHSQSQLKSLDALSKASQNNLNNTSLPINYETEVESTQLVKTEIWQVNESEVSQASDSSNTSHVPSEEISDSSISSNDEEPGDLSRRVCKSKSSFCPNPNSIKLSINKLNKSFLGGREEWLFPRGRPIQNLVILKKNKELYILSEYLNQKEKKFIIDKAISRFRLKIKLKHQLKKCLFYKILTINEFQETKVFEDNPISIPFLFMIKEYQLKDGYQLKMVCCSIKLHPDVPTAVDFIASFHREKEKVEPKEQKNKRVSNMKNSLNRRSKDTKRKSSVKMGKRDFHEQHEKSSFHSSKQTLKHFKPFSPELIQKFEEFMSHNLISLWKQRFFTKVEVAIAIRSIIRIQASFRRKRQSKHYQNLKSQYNQDKDKRQEQGRLCKYFKEQKIFISCTTWDEKTVTVYIQSLQFGMSNQIGRFTYPKQYHHIIRCEIVAFTDEGSFLQKKVRLEENIDEAIFKQNEIALKLERERPEKNRRGIQKFFFKVFLRLKARHNIFFMKKLIIKDRLFLLIIRRNSQMRSILDCSLYDFPNNPAFKEKGNNLSNSKQMNSDMGCHRQISHHSNRDLVNNNSNKSYKYQHIYLKQQYFRGIEKKAIADEFLIDYKVFLLKPPKGSNVYYIERLGCLDINSEQITKELQNLDKEGSQFKQSALISNKSLKCLLNQTYAKKNYANQKLSGSKPKETNSFTINSRKNSLQQNNLQLLDAIRQTYIKQLVPLHSRASLADSNSHKNRQGFKIKENSHQSVIYYSLYKSVDIFFYVDLYIVKRTPTLKNYSEVLSKVDSQRLYKKQLQDMGIGLINKKIAEWLNQNGEDCLMPRQTKDKFEENTSKMDFEGGMNIFNKCLQLIESSSTKRFSYDIHKNVLSLGEKEKGRNNTLTI